MSLNPTTSCNAAGCDNTRCSGEFQTLCFKLNLKLALNDCVFSNSEKITIN